MTLRFDTCRTMEIKPMKTYSITSPGQGIKACEMIDAPAPKPGIGEVVVAVNATSLNYRDILIAKGLYPIPSVHNAVPLSDGAGEIVEVDAGVTKWKVGDRVCGSFFQNWKNGTIPEDAQRYSL